VSNDHFKHDADRLRRAFPHTARPIDLDEDHVGESETGRVQGVSARRGSKRHTFSGCLAAGAIGGIIGGTFGGCVLSSHTPAGFVLFVGAIGSLIGVVPGLLFGLLAIAVGSGLSDGASAGAVNRTLVGVAFCTSAVLAAGVTMYVLLQAMASC
jgi:hypothetical protein